MAKTCRIPVILPVLLAALFFSACGDPDKAKKVKLRAAPGSAREEAAPGVRKEFPLRISVAAMLSPRASFVTYGEMVRYIGERQDIPVTTVFTKKYSETNDALRNSESDIAFICTGAYLAANEEFPLEVLAVPVVGGVTVYHSIILVGRNSPLRGFRDLKGKVFAFTDEFSLTGRMYVQGKLADMGKTADFFRATLFTGSHDNSIKAVAEGFADAACVDELIYLALLRKGDFYARQLRVLEKSQPFGIPPVVARRGLGAGIIARTRAILLAMHKDAEGARILKGVAIERFALPAPGLYSSAYELLKKTGRPAARQAGAPR